MYTLSLIPKRKRESSKSIHMYAISDQIVAKI